MKTLILYTNPENIRNHHQDISEFADDSLIRIHQLDFEKNTRKLEISEISINFLKNLPPIDQVMWLNDLGEDEHKNVFPLIAFLKPSKTRVINV